MWVALGFAFLGRLCVHVLAQQTHTGRHFGCPNAIKYISEEFPSIQGHQNRQAVVSLHTAHYDVIFADALRVCFFDGIVAVTIIVCVGCYTYKCACT